MPRREVQLSVVRQIRLADRGKDPWKELRDKVPDAENDEARRVAERKGALEEAAWRALQREFPLLPSLDQGALVALWSDVEGETIEDIAAHFDLKAGTLRQAKRRALFLYDPCELNAEGTACTARTRCAHAVGAEVYRALVSRAAISILREVKDELGPE